MANVLLMQTENVRSFATQTISDLDDLETRIGNSANQVANLDWTAPGRDSYVYEFQQTAQTVRRLLEEGRELCRRADQESQRWEVMAGGGSSGASTVTHSSRATYLDTLLDTIAAVVGPIGNLYDFAGAGIVSAAALASFREFRPGVSAIYGSKAIKSFVMGLKPGTTVMTQAKFTGKTGHINNFVRPLAFWGFIFDTANDAYSYKDQGAGMIASSVAVNVLVSAAGLAVAGAIGTASAPAVIAGAAVGVGLGLAMELPVGPNGQTVEDMCVKGVHDIGKSVVDNAPEFFENVSDGVNKLSSWVRDPITSTSGSN
jgi:hypothetical protein